MAHAARRKGKNKARKRSAGRKKPPLFFGLFCIVAFFGLIGLGTWQLKRLAWKEDLLETIRENADAPPLLLTASAPSDITFRHAVAMGRFLYDQEIVIQGKYMGTQQGGYVFTPFELNDGAVFMVNRGWIPKNKVDYTARPDSRPAGVRQVKGILWVFDEPWGYLPKNRPEKNLWLWATRDELTAYLAARNPGKPVLPLLLAQTEPSPGATAEMPLILPKKITVRNDHLQYAITWYLLAAIVAVMSFLYLRKNGK